MPQSTILSPGTTAAVSTDVVVAAGVVVAVGIYTASASIPTDVNIDIRHDTPGSDAFVARLSSANQVVLLTGPGTFRAVRRAIGVAVGVYLET